MLFDSITEIAGTDDPYVATSIARAAISKIIHDSICSRITHFDTIYRLFEPSQSKLIQLALSIQVVSYDVAEQLMRIEDVFADRNSKSIDLESKEYFSIEDQTELSKHDGYRDLDAKHIFIVWLIYTLHALAEETIANQEIA